MASHPPAEIDDDDLLIRVLDILALARQAEGAPRSPAPRHGLYALTDDDDHLDDLTHKFSRENAEEIRMRVARWFARREPGGVR